VLLVVPVGVLGALLGAWSRDFANDVYFKVGLITIIGLSAKNAVLIIEFAKDLQAQGKGVAEAALEAIRLRFRPIIMTTLADLMGAVPIALGLGADGESRRPLGLVIVGGLVVSQLITLYLTPVVYTYMAAMFKTRRIPQTATASDLVI
jgi:multidrug efflux pump